ncbi:MAG: hypothetical protein ACF8NJ_09590 [Phycisphaerales bacterium JB038]
MRQTSEQEGAARPWQFASRCLALILVAGVAKADTIDFGLPLTDVTILDIGGGEIRFLHNGVTLTRPLETVEAVHFDDLPGLQQAEQLLQQDKVAEAIEVLERTLMQATEEVQRRWLHSRLAVAQGQAGRPAAALAHLARVVSSDPDSHWLLLVPAVDEMSATQEEIAAARAVIVEARRNASSPVLDTLESVLEHIPVKERTGDADETPVLTEASDRLRFPSVAAHLQAGEPAEALVAIERLARRAQMDDLPELYFHAGAACELLADPAAAGLCYLRLAAHFPESPWTVQGLIAASHLYETSFANPDAALRLARRALETTQRLKNPSLRATAQARVDVCLSLTSGDQP